MISLDLAKSSEVRIAGDRSKCIIILCLILRANLPKFKHCAKLLWYIRRHIPHLSFFQLCDDLIHGDLYKIMATKLDLLFSGLKFFTFEDHSYVCIHLLTEEERPPPACPPKD